MPSIIPASEDSQRTTNLPRAQPKSTTRGINETNVIEGKRTRKQATFAAVREELSRYGAFHAELTNATTHKKQRLHKRDLPPLLRFWREL